MKMDEKIQTKVLREVWNSSGTISVDQIRDNTGLGKDQVYRALAHLKNRSLIEKKIEKFSGGYKIPPTGKMEIKCNNKVGNRIRTILGEL